MSVDLKSLRRATDTAYVSPFAPFPAVLAPATTRDYTITPAYELPVLAGIAQKLSNIPIAVAKPHVHGPGCNHDPDHGHHGH